MAERPNNAFLRSLTTVGFEAVAVHLQPVELRLSQEVSRPDEKVEWIYFPLNCLLSMITTTSSGEQVETAMVGNEGALGVVEACGSGVAAMLAVVQVDGRALRAPAAAFRRAVLEDEDLWNASWRLIELQLNESRQSGMCQALHSVEPRLARWLLESAERSGGRNPLPMTQEFLSAMLGVQRTTVTSFAAQLQKAGLITYTRGKLDITDAAALEKRACECRTITRRHRQRLGWSPATRRTRATTSTSCRAADRCASRPRGDHAAVGGYEDVVGAGGGADGAGHRRRPAGRQDLAQIESRQHLAPSNASPR
jgi:CRP-like cAMP-binding protein